MPLDRRRLTSLTAGFAWNAASRPTLAATTAGQAVRRPDGTVDWRAVRSLFPLAADKIHLSSFLFVSHPAPVAEAIERFRKGEWGRVYIIHYDRLAGDGGRWRRVDPENRGFSGRIPAISVM